jgi:short-subunit dehydrogenase
MTSSPHRRQQSRAFRRYGSWALVTGASDGIGRAIATQLAQQGFNLVLVARRQSALDGLASDLERLGAETRVIASDLGPRDRAAWLDNATADLDVGLVVAAAGFGTTGELTSSNLETELDMVDLNCRSVVELSAVFGRRLADRGRGGIILFGSLMGFQGAPRMATYAATKAFVQTLAEGLSRELEKSGVDVLATAPGPTRTGFAARAEAKMALTANSDDVARATIAALGRQRTVRPGVIAKFLGWSLLPLPRQARTSVMSLITAGMTSHKSAAAKGA